MEYFLDEDGTFQKHSVHKNVNNGKNLLKNKCISNPIFKELNLN